METTFLCREISIIHKRNGDGFEQSVRDRERWLASGYVLKEVPTGFPDVLRQGEFKDSTVFLA